jgi:hypothetical protein
VRGVVGGETGHSQRSKRALVEIARVLKYPNRTKSSGGPHARVAHLLVDDVTRRMIRR